jgi:hypothetical protein
MSVPKNTSSHLRCISPGCSKFSSVACPCQLCASDCHCGPGGPCTSHITKPMKSKMAAVVPHQSGNSNSVFHQTAGSMELYRSSDDEDLALAIQASLKASASPDASSSWLLSPTASAGYADTLSPSAPLAPKPPTATTVKPCILSQMPPIWQAKLEGSSKSMVAKEERAGRQALLQQALKENLNILFFDQDDEPGQQLALQGSEDMPDFPWVKPEEFIHHFGPNIIAIDHCTPIWLSLATSTLCIRSLIMRHSSFNAVVFAACLVSTRKLIKSTALHLQHTSSKASAASALLFAKRGMLIKRTKQPCIPVTGHESHPRWKAVGISVPIENTKRENEQQSTH